MDFRKCTSFKDAPAISMAPLNFSLKVHTKPQFEESNLDPDRAIGADVDIDLKEVYFLIMHFLSTGPCRRTFEQFLNELLEYQLLPRRYHAWYSRSGEFSGDANDNGISFPLSYDNVAERYSHIENDHLVKLLKQLIRMSPLRSMVERTAPSAADVPTLLGIGPFSLLSGSRNKLNPQVKPLPAYLRWPHMQADQVRGLTLREIGGGFRKHHRAPSIRFACYTIAKPSTMVQKMQNIKKLRGHRDAVYCAIFDRSGRYVITGSDDRLVKIWSMETAFCLSSCRGHEGDITDLAVSSNNVVVASASNDCSIRVWRLADGFPISVLRGHKAAVTAIAFSPRPNSAYQLLSSSDDGTCRIWDARSSQCSPRIYLPKPTDAVYGKNNCPPSNGPSSSNAAQSHQILCCAFNSNGTVFVTGSSDTFARVWSACRPNTDDPEQPIHEIDVLAGHENDVNYVQFSGCSVASRSATTDSLMEEKVPKFKNSWYSHDNIVTCSRDGSAIIWIPKLRRSHGKVGRWTRAYHLKVPPPPMPPQPPRGGPRQRLLPTPRGVNMIIWSLDNRFVLAAIMDCRICVWNASDGSLVHSLTGHSESTYVLDVHPFNPRIAMSAGYDGKTIVWDIWEGTPIRIYEIGRFKLVDGKFSPDGTSIVLSDDVGQIYLLSTGQGESQEDAKYDQFFLGDYRPLIQDTQGNVLDQETQLLPHRRNLQDPLCDSSLIPYPEPYQSNYQRRRLGALGIEWRPSTIKFAVGTDIGLGQEYQVLPLADLDIVIEPLPEFIDAMYWEPENDVINDDNDSEYNVTEEYSSGDDRGSLSNHSSSDDPECSEEDKFDGLRRSKRKKPRVKVGMKTSGRRIRRKNMIELDDGVSSSRSKRNKWKNSLRISNRKSSKAQSLRPQRVSARSSTTFYSQTGASTAEEEEEEEDEEEEYGSEDDSSESESLLQDSMIKSDGPVGDLQNLHCNYSKASLDESTSKSPNHLNFVNRKKLILKFKVPNPMKPVVSENAGTVCVNQANLTSSSSKSKEEHPKENAIDISLGGPRSSSANMTGLENSESRITKSREGKELKAMEDHWEKSADYKDGKIRWGECKMRSAKRVKTEDLMVMDSGTGFSVTYDGHDGNRSHVKEYDVKPAIDHGYPFIGSGVQNLGRNEAHREEEEFGTGGLENRDDARKKEFSPRENGDLPCNSDVELKEDPVPKAKILRIKTKNSLVVSKTPSKIKFINSRPPGGGDLVLEESTSSMKQNLILGESEDEVPERPSSFYTPERPRRSRVDSEDGGESISNTRSHNHEARTEFPEAATDAMRRTRSLRLSATSRDASHKFKETRAVGTSRSAAKSFKNSSSDQWTSTSANAIRSRSASSRNRGDDYDNNNDKEQSGLTGKKLPHELRKSNWLLLTEQEECCRYIPQLGDEVVYLRQGHDEHEKGRSSIPSMEIMKAAEVCLVKNLEYASVPGSGESCCKLTLKFIDSSCRMCGEIIEFTLPELNNCADFVVERRWYDASIKRKWSEGDVCRVWWKDELNSEGEWWKGEIMSSKDQSSEFPGSPWQRYSVKYCTESGDSEEQHSPWELHDLETLPEQPCINVDTRNKMISYLTKLHHSATRNEDKHGILKMKQVGQKLEFLNRYPVPLSLEVIMLRLENSYYRSLKAMRHDISVMLTNAREYFSKSVENLARVKRLSDWFDKTYLKL